MVKLMVSLISLDECLFLLLIGILDWYPLLYRGKRAGEIYLELTFYSAVSKVMIYMMI